jgi:tetratricopeptide (TPR) repeat protein
VGEPGNKPEPEFVRIEPAPIDLTPARGSLTPESSRPRFTRQAAVWGGLGLLLVSAALVIFLLPRWVGPPAIEIGPAAAVPLPDRSRPPAATSSAAAVKSPWEQAQDSKLRRDTQAILEQILEAQKLLTERGVNAWASQEYEQALQFARTGDERYNERDFAGARQQYEQGLAILQGLQERVDNVFEDALTRGDQALADGDSAAAVAAFDLALAIDPADRAALQGRERADKLDAVLAQQRKGDRLLADDQLDDAEQAYRQALALDEHTGHARQQIAVVEQRLQEREFNDHMSAGFTAIYNGQADPARRAFTQALKIKPSSAEARAGLEQSQHELTARSIEALLSEARGFEAEERWHDALAKYTAALERDPALAAAQAGRDRSAVRAQIHDRLEQILARPERLYDADVLNDAEAFHRTIGALENPGPLLSGQIERLGNLLGKMRMPVTVQLRSDNLTRVTLYKVGELGYFTSQEISLRPGRYVAVGVREGYRDVRVEFTVDPDRPVPVINISADDKIAFGGQT